MSKRLALPFTLAAFIALPALADDARPHHYRGEPAETLEQAVRNFSEYNTRLEAALAEEPLDLARLDAIHQLTYTLENALNKIRADLETTSETLEAVHKASEHGDAETARREGEKYLRAARTVIK